MEINQTLALHPFLNTNIFVMKTKISGTTCPFPGSLPHGNWTCEIPILGTSFLDEDAQSYPGNEFTKSSYFQPEIYFQPYNVVWSVSLAMWPSGHLLSPASMGNMQKGVIIRKNSFFFTPA